MKKYRVTVNGTVYEIELEELTGTAPVSAPAAPVVPAPAATPAAAAPAGGEKITSPMPGTILAVNVTSGAAVKKGDVLFVLEAKKMENEIMLPVTAPWPLSIPPRAQLWSPALCCAFSSNGLKGGCYGSYPEFYQRYRLCPVFSG